MSRKAILVGAGAHGMEAYAKSAFLEQAQAGRLEPVAVVEPDAERRAQALSALGLAAARGFGRIEGVWELEPDLVVVATPYFAHEEVCMAASEAGCDLFIEKPVSDSLESCCRIQEAVTKSGVRAAVNMSARFESEKRAFGEALASGAAGRVEYLFGRMSWDHGRNAKYRIDTPYPYLNEGGVHALDMLRGYAGGKPERVFHMAYRSPGSVFQGFASSVVSVEMDNGVCFVLEGSWTVQAGINTWRNEYIRADGDAGALLLDHQRLTRLSGSEMEPEGLRREELGDFSDSQTNRGTSYLFKAFLDWLDGKRQSHPTQLDDNMQLMALLFAAFESADRKQAVLVQNFLEDARERSWHDRAG